MDIVVNNIAINVPAVSLLLCSIFSNSFINCQNQNQNQQNQCEVKKLNTKNTLLTLLDRPQKR